MKEPITECMLTEIALFDAEEAKVIASETGEGYQCVSCHGDFTVDTDHEPTAVWHGCAHELLQRLAAKAIGFACETIPGV